VIFLCLPKLGRVESVSLLACPGWGLKNRFYFLLAQIGDGRIGFTSCLPKLGMGESVSLLACPSWEWKNQFYFLLAQVGQRRIGFTSCLPKLGRVEFSFSLYGLIFLS
jgi:hypothetical protein